jgi:hypothetical protein
MWRHRLGEFEPRDAQQILSVIDNHDKFVEELRGPLLRPFRFEKNSHNAQGGVRAFLAGSKSSDFWIHLRRIDNENVLVVSESAQASAN